MLEFVAEKICGGWLDDAWSRNPPNSVFQVSSKINTGPAPCSNTASELHIYGLQHLEQNFVGE
jgi:hypothetical protein